MRKNSRYLSVFAKTRPNVSGILCRVPRRVISLIKHIAYHNPDKLFTIMDARTKKKTRLPSCRLLSPAELEVAYLDHP